MVVVGPWNGLYSAGHQLESGHSLAAPPFSPCCLPRLAHPAAPVPCCAQNLAHHLLCAERLTDLRQLLTEPTWIEAKLHAYGVAAIVQDFRRCVCVQLFPFVLAVNTVKDSAAGVMKPWSRHPCEFHESITYLRYGAYATDTLCSLRPHPLPPHLQIPGQSGGC